MSIDLGFDLISPDSEWTKNLKHNESMSDNDGVFLGNCYYTNSMINEVEEKNKNNTNKTTSNIIFDPYENY